MKIRIEELRNLIIHILQSKYYSDEQASQIAEVLMYGEMTNKSTMGVIKLLGTEPMQDIKPQYEPKVIKDTKVSALIDGGGNPSILVCRKANDIVINKCKDNGIAIVGTHNAYSSSGVVGYYVNEIAKCDFIGIVFAGSPGGVVPFGSLDPLFGTNPLAVGFPTENDPIVFDMATAALTWYSLVQAKTLGQKLPDNMAIDENGNPTVDPNEAMKGGILPFDKGYKSSGLAMMIEILTGPLAGGTFATADGIGDWSNIFIAIDPEILAGKEQFKKTCTELIRKIKNSRKAKGFKEILIPGERGFRYKKNAEQAGAIEINEQIYKQLKQL